MERVWQVGAASAEGQSRLMVGLDCGLVTWRRRATCSAEFMRACRFTCVWQRACPCGNCRQRSIWRPWRWRRVSSGQHLSFDRATRCPGIRTLSSGVTRMGCPSITITARGSQSGSCRRPMGRRCGRKRRLMLATGSLLGGGVLGERLASCEDHRRWGRRRRPLVGAFIVAAQQARRTDLLRWI